MTENLSGCLGEIERDMWGKISPGSDTHVSDTYRKENPCYGLLGGGNSDIFLCSPRKLGKMNPFDEPIFQMG